MGRSIQPLRRALVLAFRHLLSLCPHLAFPPSLGTNRGLRAEGEIFFIHHGSSWTKTSFN